MRVNCHICGYTIFFKMYETIATFIQRHPWQHYEFRKAIASLCDSSTRSAKMKIYHGIEDFVRLPNAIVTSGTFDGVHVGHTKILTRLREIASKTNGETVVITFWPHPRLVLHPEDHSLKLLNTFEEKADLLKAQGIHHLIRIPFTREFSQLTSEEFITKILIETIGTKTLVIGYDHHFGKNREGSFEQLKLNAPKYGFEVEEIPRQEVDHLGVSSTAIRKALERGDIE